MINARLRILTVLVLVASSCRDQARRSEMLRVDQKSNNTEVVLAVGQELEIALAENPTTGFRWELLSSGEPSCVLVDNVFDPPSPVVPGRGGTRRWHFRGAREGSGRIELVYRRATERDKPPAQTFNITARIER